MYQLLPESNGGFVALQLTGKLEAGDYDGIVPIFEERIAQHGKISLFWEMRDFHGWTVGGLAADTKFDVKHAGDFTRIALVGEKKWHELMAALMKPFTIDMVSQSNVPASAARGETPPPAHQLQLSKI